ncbi:MAG: methylmalonyl-CoA mutase family protein, partial [Paraprevotella sp.]|nr:methylmalonyl-CoA mutase family protein [Paraprevotella sp.]
EELKDMTQTDALPGEFPFLRGNKKDNNRWYVRQNLKADDPKETNAKALDLLNKGITSLGFRIPAKKMDASFISTLLEGIKADAVELNFSTCQGHTVELARLLTAYFNEKGYDPSRLVGSINFDPMQKMLTKGKDTSALLNQRAELVRQLEPFSGIRCVCVNADTLCNSGAYIYQELGYALAWGNEYLHLMVEAGIPADLAARKIKFNFGISGVYFMEIAKFRAARILWSHIVKPYLQQTNAGTGCDKKAGTPSDCACKMYVNATTSTYNMTVFDSYVNMLRTQTETMSAALANVDSIVVMPFDVPYETPTEFAERIARNQQLLLQEESHFDKIVDVAGGSYFIEKLTHSLANEAWKLFLAVEDEGGFLSAIRSGNIQTAVNQTNAQRHANAGKRKEFILGTNQFPNFNEKREGKVPLDHCACGCQHEQSEMPFAKLESTRLAADFEALRMQTEKAKKQPVAFMLTIGNLAMRQARAQFCCNFLACAGYKVIDNLGFPTVEEGIDAAMKAGADIVVLCSSDDEYAEYAVPAFKALNGRAMFVVAGAPACAEDLKAAGIENFIHVRVDKLKTLKEYNAKLGIK